MVDISVGVRAYCKLILHAAKYPHCSVNGVLLAEKPKAKDVKNVKFVDAIPLFHLSLGLAPMMEVALTQVDAYCKNQGLVIAGYYQANEHYSDANPNVITYRIADRILEQFGEAVIFMVDNRKMSLDCEEEAYKIYKHTDGKWKHRDTRGTADKGALAAAASMLSTCAYRELVDFDCHLDDISLDWINPEINELLSHTT